MLDDQKTAEHDCQIFSEERQQKQDDGCQAGRGQECKQIPGSVGHCKLAQMNPVRPAAYPGGEKAAFGTMIAQVSTSRQAIVAHVQNCESQAATVAAEIRYADA